MIKPAYSVSFLLSINIFVWQNVLYFLDAPRKFVIVNVTFYTMFINCCWVTLCLLSSGYQSGNIYVNIPLCVMSWLCVHNTPASCMPHLLIHLCFTAPITFVAEQNL